MILTIVIVIWLVSSLLIAFAGSKFRFGFWGYFFASVLLTPIMGVLLLAAAVPPRRRA